MKMLFYKIVQVDRDEDKIGDLKCRVVLKRDPLIKPLCVGASENNEELPLCVVQDDVDSNICTIRMKRKKNLSFDARPPKRLKVTDQAAMTDREYVWFYLH